MTTQEKWIFKGIVGFGVLLALAILSLTVFGIYFQDNSVETASLPVVRPTESAVPRLSDSEEESLMRAFRQKIAPIEVGPAHRAVEEPLVKTFEAGQEISNEAFELFLKPLLEAYFIDWYAEMARQVFEERQLEMDEDMMTRMLSSVGVEDKVHFMLLYEKVFLKNRGIVIEDKE